MITEINIVSEIKEVAPMTKDVGVSDEIKRNHLQQLKVNPISDNLDATDFTLTFARLKRSLRKRSSTIL